MKTLNTNEELPEHFYVFLHNNRMWTLKWNYRLSKTLISASIINTLVDSNKMIKLLAGDINYLPYVPNPKVDIVTPSSFSLREVSEYTVDYNAELYRAGHQTTKKYPSRFGCLYAFGSIEDAQSAANQWNFDMNDLVKFKLGASPVTRVIKVNMQIISQMWTIGSAATFEPETNEHIWGHYWSGKGELPLEVPNLKTGQGTETVNHGVIWEYLIDGKLELAED